MTSLRYLLAAALLFCCAVGVFSLIALVWAATFGWVFGVQIYVATALTALILTGAISVATTAVED